MWMHFVEPISVQRAAARLGRHATSSVASPAGRRLARIAEALADGPRPAPAAASARATLIRDGFFGGRRCSAPCREEPRAPSTIAARRTEHRARLVTTSTLSRASSRRRIVATTSATGSPTYVTTSAGAMAGWHVRSAPAGAGTLFGEIAAAGRPAAVRTPEHRASRGPLGVDAEAGARGRAASAHRGVHIPGTRTCPPKRRAGDEPLADPPRVAFPILCCTWGPDIAPHTPLTRRAPGTRARSIAPPHSRRALGPVRARFPPRLVAPRGPRVLASIPAPDQSRPRRRAVSIDDIERSDASGGTELASSRASPGAVCVVHLVINCCHSGKRQLSTLHVLVRDDGAEVASFTPATNPCVSTLDRSPAVSRDSRARSGSCRGVRQVLARRAPVPSARGYTPLRAMCAPRVAKRSSLAPPPARQCGGLTRALRCEDPVSPVVVAVLDRMTSANHTCPPSMLSTASPGATSRGRNRGAPRVPRGRRAVRNRGRARSPCATSVVGWGACRPQSDDAGRSGRSRGRHHDPFTSRGPFRGDLAPSVENKPDVRRRCRRTRFTSA